MLCTLTTSLFCVQICFAICKTLNDLTFRQLQDVEIWGEYVLFIIFKLFGNRWDLEIRPHGRNEHKGVFVFNLA